MKKNDLLIIIPAYNEEGSIQKVVDDLIANCPEYDYVVVNDGSTDRTSQICHECNFEIIDLPINLGLEAAFQTGLKYAKRKNYEYAMQFDADGQHDSNYINLMLEEIEKGYDIVIGSRFVGDKKPFNLRMIGSRMITRGIKITTGVTINDPTSGMRMFSKQIIKEFAENINYGPEPDTISYLIKNGASISEVQVCMNDRFAGESYLTTGLSMQYMLRMIISIFLIQNFRRRSKL